MDKIKEKLHLGSSSKKSAETDSYGSPGRVGTIEENRESIDEELAQMTPQERVAYLSEMDHSDKYDEPKKGGLIEKLIARGNRRTEEQLERDSRAREEAHKKATHAAIGPGAGASAQSAAGPGGY